MTAGSDTPLSGVFRVVYFLATAVVSVLVLVTAIVSFYEPPQGDEVGFPRGGGIVFQEEGDSRQDYNRNVSLILTTTSAAMFAASILGLGSRFNPLRAALLLGGLALYLTGIGFWAGSADQWIGFALTLIAFAILAGSYPWLEEGLPIGGPTARLGAGPPTLPTPPAPPPPSVESAPPGEG